MKDLLQGKALKAIEAIQEAAGYIWTKGWAERNAGNISHNFTDVWDPKIGADGPVVSYPGIPKEAENMVLFITGTGRRLRELSRPDEAGAVVRLHPSLGGYRILWGGDNNPEYKISSEAPSHILLHLDVVKRGSPYRCVLHTHPLGLIVLSHHPELGKDEAAFTRAIWEMIPEVRAFVPRGVGIVPYTLPGSQELGEKTMASLAKRDVALWSKHGATSLGKDALEAFDFIDVADKGARLLLDCWSAGFKPTGYTKQQMDELVDIFKLPKDDF